MPAIIKVVDGRTVISVNGAQAAYLAAQAGIQKAVDDLGGTFKGDKGDTGPANNTYTDLATFKAQPVTNEVATLVIDNVAYTYTWKAGSTGTADDDNYIASTFAGAPAGKWEKKRQALYSEEIAGGIPALPTITSISGKLRHSAILSGRNNVITQDPAGVVGDADGVLIVGGFDNTITGGSVGAEPNKLDASVIVGGFLNSIVGFNNFIGGGKGNGIIGDITNYCFIGSGDVNKISGEQAFLSAIVGGRNNQITGTAANRCFIGCGADLLISGTSAAASVIVGGRNSQITGANAFYSFIGGGDGNKIQGNQTGYSSIVGGAANIINASSTFYSFIGGGQSNSITANSSTHSIILGGRENALENNTPYSAVLSGYLNRISGQRSVIVGGYNNYINSSSGTQNAIGGGNDNQMLSTNVQNSLISGGASNTVGVALSPIPLTHVSILGGSGNTIIADRGTSVGGQGLLVNAFHEVTKGRFNKSDNPDGIGVPSKTIWTGNQILESLGIGTDDANRANAYVWLKNGKQIRYNTPVYADNAAAVSGGELVGTVYRTSTGVLMEVY